ncbi:hypothetical protein [Pseudooceanicola nanhaiensis]|jgi:hypothetical protein|uniref:hypothetical protein n=1 Tax=Pseudooceanicola nanhaiensis TaxID=375761 RepID=UPI0012EC2D1F|nr:hypothetical protein [Pseudooceanicola nanhaiensis]
MQDFVVGPQLFDHRIEAQWQAVFLSTVSIGCLFEFGCHDVYVALPSNLGVPEHPTQHP